MKKNLFLVLFFIFFLYGCGGGSASSSGATNTTPTPITPSITEPDVARLADTFADGIEYRCGDNISGITGDTGETGGFKYESNCTVEFSIGKIYLGDINGSLLKPELIVYPTNILGVGTKDTNNTKVVSLARLMQSLDSDDNLSNGIIINGDTRTALSGITVSELDFSKDSITSTDISTLVSKAFPSRATKTSTEALTHFNNTLTSQGYSLSELKPSTPYFIDPYTLQQKTYTQILSTHIKEKTFLLHGEPGTTVWVALSNNATEPSLANFTNTNNLMIGADWKQYITLSFNNPSMSTYHYFIKLKDNAGNFSDSFKIVISNDSIPPHVENTNIIEEVLEEQLLFRNIHATDDGGIKLYRIVSLSEDSRSTNDTLFTIDQNGTVTFKNEPNFDENLNAVFSVVTRAMDFAGNMTDLLLQVILKNVLDNPPQLTATSFTTSILEALPNGTIVFDLSSTLEQNLTKAPDNDPTLSPIYYHLNNHTDIFDINKTTGIISIKDNTNALFDFEQSPNTIELNVSVENNNSHPRNDINTTYATLTVNILNKIDTAPKLVAPSSVLTIPEKSSNYSSNYPIGGILKDELNSDKNLTMTFSISNGNSDNSFMIDAITGILYVKSANNLDYETTKQYTLTIRATNTWWNGTTYFDEVNQTIDITDVVDNVPIIVLKTLTNTLPESTASGVTIATVDVNGTNSDENLTTSYTIDSVLKNGTTLAPGSIPFTISNTGIVSTSRQLLGDYVESVLNTTDTVFRVTIKALNQWWNGTSGESSGVVFDVNVTNVIDNPPVITTPSFALAFDENTTLGSIVYDVNTSGTTYDTNMVTNFSIASGNSENKFSINATTGVISLANSLDWETTTSYLLGITASNVDWNSTARTSDISYVTISVNNIIESPPSISGPTTLNIHENIDIGELLDSVKINSIEEDKKTIDSMTIVAGNSENKFKIGSLLTDTVTNLKYVEFSLINKLDYETTKNYTIDINATNSFGSSTHTINVNVLDDMEKDLPLLITMIEYDDINITTLSEVFNKIFSQNPPTPPSFGSLNDYFSRISKTKFLFKKAVETDGTADGIIKVHLNKNHPKTDINRLSDDIRDGLIAADSYINFASYDNNNDGNISKDELQLLFLIAGGERTYGDTNLSITGASGSLDTILTLDGKNVAYTSGNGNYVVVGEKNGINGASIGLIAHHLGNTALNFPYLNDRTIASYGIGYFGLMGYGYRGALSSTSDIGTTPVNPSAYSVISQGWVYPRVIDRSTSNITMVVSNKGINGFNILKIPTSDSKIYYLLENRATTDLVGYDDGFYRLESTHFNGGLALWKINENYIDTNNDSVNNKLVDLIEYDLSSDIDTKVSFGKSSSLYHVGNPTYPSSLALPFSISNSTLDLSTKTMTIDISFP